MYVSVWMLNKPYTCFLVYRYAFSSMCTNASWNSLNAHQLFAHWAYTCNGNTCFYHCQRKYFLFLLLHHIVACWLNFKSQSKSSDFNNRETFGSLIEMTFFLVFCTHFVFVIYFNKYINCFSIKPHLVGFKFIYHFHQLSLCTKAIEMLFSHFRIWSLLHYYSYFKKSKNCCFLPCQYLIFNFFLHCTRSNPRFDHATSVWVTCDYSTCKFKIVRFIDVFYTYVIHYKCSLYLCDFSFSYAIHFYIFVMYVFEKIVFLSKRVIKIMYYNLCNFLHLFYFKKIKKKCI